MTPNRKQILWLNHLLLLSALSIKGRQAAQSSYHYLPPARMLPSLPSSYRTPGLTSPSYINHPSSSSARQRSTSSLLDQLIAEDDNNASNGGYERFRESSAILHPVPKRIQRELKLAETNRNAAASDSPPKPPSFSSSPSTDYSSSTNPRRKYNPFSRRKQHLSSIVPVAPLPATPGKQRRLPQPKPQQPIPYPRRRLNKFPSFTHLSSKSQQQQTRPITATSTSPSMPMMFGVFYELLSPKRSNPPLSIQYSSRRPQTSRLFGTSSINPTASRSSAYRKVDIQTNNDDLLRRLFLGVTYTTNRQQRTPLPSSRRSFNQMQQAVPLPSPANNRRVVEGIFPTSKSKRNGWIPSPSPSMSSSSFVPSTPTGKKRIIWQRPTLIPYTFIMKKDFPKALESSRRNQQQQRKERQQRRKKPLFVLPKVSRSGEGTPAPEPDGFDYVSYNRWCMRHSFACTDPGYHRAMANYPAVCPYEPNFDISTLNDRQFEALIEWNHLFTTNPCQQLPNHSGSIRTTIRPKSLISTAELIEAARQMVMSIRIQLSDEEQ